MENRQIHIKTDTVPAMSAIEGIDRQAEVVYPIIYGGDVSGAVALLESDKNELPSEADIKLVQVAAAFLGKQMEQIYGYIAQKITQIIVQLDT